MEQLNINNAAQQAFNNKGLVDQCTKAGCYYCLKIFETSEIVEYVDDGHTAVCPYCNVDAVLAENSGEITVEFLQRAKRYWFSSK